MDISRNLKNTLANASLFKMLDDRQLDEIVFNTSPMRLAQNMSVINQGDVADGTFWVAYGQVKICMYSKQGGEKTLAILGSDKCFGLGEMLLEQPHLAYVKTTADSMLLHTGRDAMLKIAQENFAFSRNLMTCVGRQFYGLVRDIGSYAQTSRQRLAAYLLSQSARESSPEIRLVANKTLIASRLSLAPETLSRLFHDFAAEGLIKISGRQIQLLDPEKMATLVS
jgi:CRP-like cAMP-binding protein